MNVSGYSRVCGILANPVEHSMSPSIQNLFGESAGVDMVYVPLKTPSGGLEAAVRGAYAMNILGMNVTVPHKQHVMEYLEDVDPTARRIGAVNTMVRVDGGYKGYNTDAAGLLRAMEESGVRIQDSRCILLGAGGAANAAADVLVSQGASQVYLLNRSLDKACALAESVNGQAGRKVMLPMKMGDYGKLPDGPFLVIQCTSVGMYPGVEEAPIEDPSFYAKVRTGVDIIYNPMETKFMKMVREAGGKAVGGLDMLVYQGAAAFELWFPHIRLDDAAVSAARVLLLSHPGGAGHG